MRLARARFIEHLVAQQVAEGIGQYVLAEIRIGTDRAAEGARASGTPCISFFMPEEMLALARNAGFKKVQHVSAATLAQRYFAGRTDGLRPPNNSEELLVATV